MFWNKSNKEIVVDKEIIEEAVKKLINDVFDDWIVKEDFCGFRHVSNRMDELIQKKAIKLIQDADFIEKIVNNVKRVQLKNG